MVQDECKHFKLAVYFLFYPRSGIDLFIPCIFNLCLFSTGWKLY